MSNALTLQGGANLPAFVRTGNTDVAKTALGGMASAPPSISLRGSRFAFVKDGAIIKHVNQLTLDVVIVGISPFVSRSYYASAFDPNDAKPPECSSWDGETPDDNSTQKQSVKCFNCPQNVKQPSHDDRSKMVTPCGYSKTMAVMIPGDTSYTVWALHLSSMTLFNRMDDVVGNNLSFKSYVSQVASSGMDIINIVTRLGFKTGESVPVLTFSPLAVVGDPSTHYDEAMYQQVVAKIDGDEINGVLRPKFTGGQSAGGTNALAPQTPQARTTTATPPPPPAADPTGNVTGGATPPPGGVVGQQPPTQAQQSPVPQTAQPAATEAAPAQTEAPAGTPFPDPTASVAPAPEQQTSPAVQQAAPVTGNLSIDALLAKNNL